MRIVIDLQSCQTGSRLGGIGRYSMALTKAMIRQPRQHEYWIVLNGSLPEAIPSIRRELMDLLPPDRIKIIYLPDRVSEANELYHTRFKAAALVRERFLQQLKPDMVLISSLFEGLYEEAVTSVGLLGAKPLTAAILYDLIPMASREKYLAEEFKYNWYVGKTDYLLNCDVALSISEFSRNEAIELLDMDPTKVVNISSAIDSYFKPLNIDLDVEEALKVKFGIRREFLMFTGSFDQRKNQDVLIKAFAFLPKEVREDYQIVFVGNGWEGIYNHLYSVAEAVDLRRDDIIFSGHINDRDLLHLYNLGKLFVFPSLSEGFGLPVLEAMSCGMPAIGSNCTSIPEVIGMEEALFDPRDYLSVRDKMLEALTNEKFYKRLVAHSLDQSAKFSWEKSAIKALDAMEASFDAASRTETSTTNRSGANIGPSRAVINIVNSFANFEDKLANLNGIDTFKDGDILEFSKCIALNDASLEAFSRVENGMRSPVRVGWVTTWNTRCGIATYTVPVMNAMPACHWIFAPYESNLIEPDGENVIRAWRLGQPDDLVDLGIAISKTNIEALVIQFNYGFYEFPSLISFINNQVESGRTVFIILHSTKDPDPTILDRKLSELVEVLSKCVIFVHQAQDVLTLASLGLTDNVTLMPLGMHEDAANKVMSKGTGGQVIATYGFALPNKGLIELIDSFALLSKADPTLHLLMVNAEFPAEASSAYLQAMNDRIREKDLASNVTIVSDYLSNADSIGYLETADLIVIPYQNTTESSSGSARMALASGKTVAVTPLFIFDDMRSAVFTLPGTSVEDMAEGISELLRNIRTGDAAVAAVNYNAHLWVKAHGFGAVGRYLFASLFENLEARACV